MTTTESSLPPEIVSEIDAYVDHVKLQLKRTGMPRHELTETVQALRAHILEMIDERSNDIPTRADIDAVFDQLEPPEAYSRDIPTMGNMFRMLWRRMSIGFVIKPVVNDNGRRRIHWFQLLLLIPFCVSAAMVGTSLFSWFVLGDFSYLWFGLTGGMAISIFFMIRLLRTPITHLPRAPKS